MNNKTDAQQLRELCGFVPGLSEPQISALQRIASQLDADAKRDEKDDVLQAIGKSAYEEIADMVAALECDYDRLAELAENDLAYKDAIEKYQEKMTDWQANADATEALEELAELREAAGEYESREDAEQRIHEDPLSVEVRGDWHSIGDQDGLNAPCEFNILLGTGGPAVRIIGELDEHGEPTRARLQTQDWGTPWTDYRGGESDTLLTYCRCFYFGEG